MPDLPRAFRGYSRPQVDQQLAELQAALQQVTAERDAARRQLAAALGALAEAQVADPQSVPPPVTAASRPRPTVRVYDEAVPPPAPPAPPAPAAEPTLAAALPRPPRSGRRGRHLILPAVALVVAILATVLVLTNDRTPSPVAEPRASSAPSPLPSSAASSASAAAPSPAVALRAFPPIPADWESYRDSQGQYAVGLPLSWRAVSADRFVSSSGKSELRVSRRVGVAPPTLADLQKREKDVAGRHPGYHRIGLAIAPFHELDAGVWSFTYGSGSSTQRVSDLIVFVDGFTYELQVQSRGVNWRFVQPLLARFRATFHPAGLS